MSDAPPPLRDEQQDVAAPFGVQPPSRRTRVITLTVATLATVGVVIAGASVALDLADRSTRVESRSETLAVEAAAPADPYADAIVVGEIERPERPSHSNPIDWKVPVDAPFETFPTNFIQPESSESVWLECSDEQFAWLKEHAEPFDSMSDSNAFNLSLRNSANTGGSLPLGNLRFEGTEAESVAWVALECSIGGRGAAGGAQPMYIDIDGSEAVYGEVLSSYAEDAQPEGSPVTVNLAPGEITELVLTRDRNVNTQRTYTGRFLADVLDGSDDTVILANDVVFQRQRVLGYKIHYIGVDYAPEGEAGSMLCIRPVGEPNEQGFFDESDRSACSTAEVAEMLAEAAAIAEQEAL
ncbi:hypothetical protein [Leucobacter chinensis]|uniref:hypothetical protein n=1 Tax=Leucobacter chinensis TaxID=2851010 RepID=UPI001C2316AE|nr:hypothetical protein [Leucobacter chinensis]